LFQYSPLLNANDQQAQKKGGGHYVAQTGFGSHAGSLNHLLVNLLVARSSQLGGALRFGFP
jgi:hypothetical protein